MQVKAEWFLQRCIYWRIRPKGERISTEIVWEKKKKQKRLENLKEKGGEVQK
jgi:hypothetical protein